MQKLMNKQILLGVTGGIAAYKSADLARRLREAGAKVRVVMTANAKEFITPLTMQAVSGHPVHEDLFDLKAEAAMGHIELARWADAIIVAPASADFMARFLSGEAHDLLSTCCLATKAPISLAPAMNQNMWKNTLTQKNVQALQAQGVHIFGPGEGSQACGDVGPGRMLEPSELVDQIAKLFQAHILSGKKALVTAGPTHEAIDPIRFITNASSGKMGYALAEALMEAGADVTLISGPVSIAKPTRVQVIDVVSAEEMFQAVMASVKDCDLFFSVAAVGDYRCKKIATQKISKQAASLTLDLERTKDIVRSVGELQKKPRIIGFAAETQNLLANANAKRIDKKMDMIIANLVGQGLGMGSDENEAHALWDSGEQAFPKMTKRKLARELVAFVGKVFFV